MHRMKSVTLSLFMLFCATVAVSQTKEAAHPTLSEIMDHAVGQVEGEFVPAAEAMPEDKYSFAPTNGEFKGVRTFAEQVKHVACANEAWAKKLRGERPPDRCDTGGPNSAKTKAEILAYLHETFVLMDSEIAKTKMDNLMAPMEGPYAGDNRLEVLNSALWHISDHYGQLVVYLRMNGIIPPASR